MRTLTDLLAEIPIENLYGVDLPNITDVQKATMADKTTEKVKKNEYRLINSHREDVQTRIE